MIMNKLIRLLFVTIVAMIVVSGAAAISGQCPNIKALNLSCPNQQIRPCNGAAYDGCPDGASVVLNIAIGPFDTVQNLGTYVTLAQNRTCATIYLPPIPPSFTPIPFEVCVVEPVVIPCYSYGDCEWDEVFEVCRIVGVPRVANSSFFITTRCPDDLAEELNDTNDKTEPELNP
jgi:hypothetical protein